MKQFIKLGLVSGLVLSGSGYALNPIQGFYGGIFAGINHGPASYNTVDSVTIYSVYPTSGTSTLIAGTVHNNGLGALGAADIGYRINKFRIEGELAYNYIRSGSLSVTGCTLQSPRITTPTGTESGPCPANTFEAANNLGFNGDIGGIYGLFNFLYDFYSYDTDPSVVPYVGFGVGGVKLRFNRNYIDSISQSSFGSTHTTGTAAGQFIIGGSFYLDDYAWIGIDYRYLTTGKVFAFNDTRYTVNTINIGVNASFDNSSN